MIVADFRVLAIGEGTSLDKPIEHALEALDEKGVKYQVGPLGTTIEADDLEALFDAVRAAHTRLRADAGRIFTQITIDERLDKEETAETLAKV